MRYIKATKPFFLGDRTRLPSDPPFEVDEKRAAILVKQGLADYAMVPPAVAGDDVVSALGFQTATNPAPTKAARATAKRA